MPSFSYIVKDKEGAKQEGVLQASSVDAALNKLREDGNTVISLHDYKESESVGKESVLDRIGLLVYKIRTMVPLKIIVFFTRQMATMFSAGLSIEKIVGQLLVEESNKRFKKVLGQLNADIKKGLPLSDSMERHPGVFTPLYIALVKSGEVSGTLHVVLEELADYLEFIQDTRRKVLSAMYYPIFVILVLIVVVTILMVKVVPMFQDVYARFNADLPFATQVLIKISETLRDNFVLSTIVLIGIGAMFIIIAQTYTGALLFDRIKLKIPILGKLQMNSLMSKYSRTFGMLMGAGVPVIDTMKLVAKVVDNLVIRLAVNESIKYVKDGYSIAASMRKTMVFPPTLMSLASTGEETGEIEKMFTKAASFYDKQVDAVVSRLTSLIEPMLIVIIASVIGSIIIVIYLPIFYLGMVMKRGMK
ncbi:MAG: type II secretion system F family protein [candidate division Zixibacteria bacterium]|nr:type II secretion system F family protein [candidate division Zixibacteria bacterium]